MKNHFTNFLIGNDLTATNKLRKILLWRDQKNAAYASKINQLNHTQWILDEYLGLVNYYIQGLTDLLLNATVDGPTSALLQVNYTTTPPKVGLIPSLNCLFVGDQVKDIYKVMCYTIIANIIQFFIIMTLLSFGMFFGSIFIFISALRFRVNGRINQI